MENEIPVYAMRDDTIRVDLGYMIQIKEGTTTINESAFSGRTELCAVIFPKSMKTIGNSAFSGCYMLLCIDIFENVTGSLESTINLPDGLTTIGSYAFSNCMSISSVNIPNSVTDLGEGSFYSCIGLTEVDIPNSVTTIPSATFSGCSGLKEISIPESVDSIGPSAFSNAKPDTIYCYAQEVPRTADKAFEGLNDAAMGKIKLFVPAISVDLYKSHAIWRKFSVQALVEDPGIKEFENGNDEDGINSTYADESVTDVYDLNGRKQSTMQRGMNIIRMSDGSVRKVLVK
jgi:hypothetical protein